MEKIQVGRLVNTHGLKGEVKVLSNSDFKEIRFSVGNKLYIEDVPVTIKSYRTHKNFDLLTFHEFSNINEIEPYKGSTLYIAESDLQELEDEEYYYFELEGLSVFADGVKIGTVMEVRENPGHDLLLVKTAEKTIYIPFVEELVIKVDLEQKRIDINAIEGLL